MVPFTRPGPPAGAAQRRFDVTAHDSCQLAGTRVLVVHDDDEFVNELTERLKAKGYNAIAAHTSAEGLGMTGVFRPRCVVTALMLEEHDSGFRLAESIKRNPLTADMGVIMVSRSRERTGYGFDQEQDGAWMRTDRYFESPVETEAIVAAVEEVIAEADRRPASARE